MKEKGLVRSKSENKKASTEQELQETVLWCRAQRRSWMKFLGLWELCARRRRRSREVQELWYRIVRHLVRVRRLQRYWAYLGRHLQTYPERLRLRLRTVWPPPSGPPRWKSR